MMLRLRCKQFLALAGLTALEIIRQPICLLLTTLLLAGIGLLPVLVTQTLSEGAKLIRDSALALQFTGGMVLGGFMASAAVHQELRRGTVSAVLAKPVDRELFFLAKYAGVALVLLVFCAEAGLATLLSARAVAQPYTLDLWAAGPLLAVPPLAFLLAGLRNYLFRHPFASGAFVWQAGLLALVFLATGWIGPEGAWTPFGANLDRAILPALVLIALAILVLAGLAVSLATRLDTVPTLALCSIVFLVGLVSDYLFGRAAAAHPVAAVLYHLVPNWQHFWVSDALNNEMRIPWRYVAQVAAYAGMYLAGVLGFGMLAFRHMEVRA